MLKHCLFGISRGGGVVNAYPAVDNHHMQRVRIEPALHGFTDGADLI